MLGQRVSIIDPNGLSTLRVEGENIVSVLFSLTVSHLAIMAIMILPRCGVIASIVAHPSFRPPAVDHLHCGTMRVGDTLELCGAQELAMCACGHLT